MNSSGRIKKSARQHARKFLSEVAREKIRAAKLIDRLQKFALNEFRKDERRYELSIAEIRAIEVLLRKCVPDLMQTEIQAQILHRYVVEMPPLLSNDEWQEKYNSSSIEPIDLKLIRQ
jgi:predicted DNA-binding protein (UPF0278 family)